VAGNQENPHWGLGKPPPDPNGRLDEQPRWGLGVADGRYGPPVGRDWIRSLAHPVKDTGAGRSAAAWVLTHLTNMTLS
jgi:hypothetical protein